MQVYNTRRQRRSDTRPAHDKVSAAKATPATAAFPAWLRRRLPFFGIILLLLASFGAVNLWLQSQESSRERAAVADQKKLDEQFRSNMAKAAANRISLAKDAEAVARANQPFDEKKYFKNLLEKNPGCDAKNPSSLKAILNKKHCLADKNWQPQDLTDVSGVKLRKQAAGALTAMMAAAEAADLGFEVTSGYRSYDEQAVLYDDAAEIGASGQPVDLISARAGYSEHQLGVSADFKILDCVLDCFGTTRRYEWLQKNAADYGFIERYPASLGEITGYIHEPWHWRYVGKETAQKMKSTGIETLEMYFGVSGGDYYAS